MEHCLESAVKSFPNNKVLFGECQPNEDFASARDLGDLSLFVVADGNDLAPACSGSFTESNVSRIACDAFLRAVDQVDRGPLPGLVRGACRAAIAETLSHMEQGSQFEQQSTTLTGLVLAGGEYSYGQIGDGALYQYRSSKGEVAEITKPAPLFIQPSVGNSLKPAVGDGLIHEGDYLLLTTDGLVGLWGKDLEVLFGQLAEERAKPSEVIERLLSRAASVSRHDDLTCFVIRCPGTHLTPEAIPG